MQNYYEMDTTNPLEPTCHQCYVSEELYPESELVRCYTTFEWVHPSNIDKFVKIVTDRFGWDSEESENVRNELINQVKK